MLIPGLWSYGFWKWEAKSAFQTPLFRNPGVSIREFPPLPLLLPRAVARNVASMNEPAEQQANDAAPALRGRLLSFLSIRAALLLLALALAAARFWLNPPANLMVWLLLSTWLATAVAFAIFEPRDAVPGCFSFALRFAYFFYEVTVVVLLVHLLGGTGWLAILFLMMPAIELNVLYPGGGGVAGSLAATIACAAMLVGEAVGRLPHDPFYSVGEPLFREPAYVLVVLLVAAVFLIGVPARIGSYARS